jgi:DNA repair ATPase RecN
MRRALYLSLGALEVLVALVLVALALELPGAEDIQAHVERVDALGKDTTHQLWQFRGQVHMLQEGRPKLHDMAQGLQKELALVTDILSKQNLDYGTVNNVSEALGNLARGLDTLGEGLGPDGVARIGSGLKAMADYLDEQVAPAATDMAVELEKATTELQENAQQLSAVLKTMPIDLKAAREVQESLGRFGDGLDRLDELLKLQHGGSMKEGFKGLEESLTTGAEQVERLAGYTYPTVRFEGIKPVVEQKQFWPAGDKIAEGMRKAAKGATAAGEELEQLTRDLPKLREALAESRKVATATRDALGNALKQQEKVESLLKRAPETATRLAERLPKLTAALAHVLRDTSRLKDVATLLRETQEGLDSVVARWPDLRKDFSYSAVLLRKTRDQLKELIKNKDEYERSFQKTLAISKTVAGTVPLLTEQLGESLEHQEQSLTNLSNSVQEVANAIPGAGRTLTRLLQTTRYLLGLLALVFALHGLSLAVAARRPAKGLPA